MTQSRQSLTNKSSEDLEAIDPGTSQLPRKSVAFSHDTYESPDAENPLDNDLPSRHFSPANGQTAAPFAGSQGQTLKRSRSNDAPVVLEQDTLGWAIRAGTIQPANKNLEPFLPRDKLLEILTEERIIQALEIEGGFSLERQKAIARDIISPEGFDHDQQPHLCSRLEILAILALVDKVPAIEDFVEEGLFDYDLPFRYVPKHDSNRPRVMRTCDLERESREIPLFYHWSDKYAELFEGQQWRIHVPVFDGMSKTSKKPPHYTLDQKAIAPYISKGQAGRGGFSAVDKVEIHTKHVPTLRNAVVAIKKLDTSKQDEFDREVAALNRFAEKHAPHLIQLLWTFSLGPTYHLVFPCAEGNLLELWKSDEFESPLADKYDHDAALWFSRQCLGIVEGLNMIHQCSSDHDPLEPQNGRHGDLKPENILWFRDSRTNERGYSLGTLKISDFGMTGFHRTQTRSHINVNGIGCSRTYRAPECEVRREVSQSYDIWCLACVLLEFATWYLKGWDGVYNFSKRRTEEDQNLPLKEDTFFNHIHEGRRTSAQAKESVAKEVQTLYEHERTSDFIIDFVDLLETSLLRMHPEFRIKCGDAVARFQQFFDRSSRSPEYCLDLSKKHPIKTNSDLSRLEPVAMVRLASDSLSPELPLIAEANTLGNETASERNKQTSLHMPDGAGSSSNPNLLSYVGRPSGQGPVDALGRWNNLKISFCKFISCGN